MYPAGRGLWKNKSRGQEATPLISPTTYIEQEQKYYLWLRIDSIELFFDLLL